MQSRKVRGARLSLIALAIIVLGLYVAFALTSIIQDYQVTIQKAELEARTTSTALSEHANRAVGEADRFLLSAVGEVERSNLDADLQNEAPLRAILQRYTNKLPQILSINIVDRNGMTVATGVDSNTPHADVSDRDYYRYLIQPGNTGLFISHPFQSRVSDHWVFTISRRISNPDGTFKMLLVAGIPVSYFDAFYQSLNVGKETRLLLVHSDGTVLAESPLLLQHQVRNIAKTPLLAHYLQSMTGSFRVDSGPYDGTSRIFGYAGSSDYPMLAAASLSESEVLISWRKRLEQTVLIGVFTIILLLSLIALLWRQLKELMQSQQDLEDQNESLAMAAQVFETSLHAITILSSDGTVLRANRAFSEITGYAQEEVIGRNVAKFESSFIDPEMRAIIMQTLFANGSWQGEAHMHRKNGDELTVKQSISMLRDASGAVHSIVAIFQDITEQKLSERRLHQLAHYDVLTNLPNRRTFSERIQHEIDLAVRHNTMLAVVFIDIDNFKTINDSLGHATGDLVLQAVASRLRACLRVGDTVARIGGDEFVVLLEGNSKRETFDRVATKLAQSLSTAIDIGGQEMYVAVSMGISVFPHDGADSETLLRNADTAMYRAKMAGRNCWRFFDESMAQHATRRLELETALRRAAERDELILHYQPQRSLHTNEIVGVEALLRWKRPQHGMIEPSEFVPLSEESGLIIAIGEWVLKTACAQAALWWRDNQQPLRIAINVAAKQIHHKDFVDLVRTTLEQSGLPPQLLELEITESSLIENIDETVNKLRQLKELGVTLAIDDFGTGYSSLSYLKQLPVDRLKIDRSFVKDTPDNIDDCAIVRTVIAMSHNLGLSVIAEGVETERQRDFLRAQHCDEIQGYLLTMPLPAEQMDMLFLENNRQIVNA